MNIVWEELRSKATVSTLMGSLRSREVACILKLRFHFTGEIDLAQVLEDMTPPEQGISPAAESQDPRALIFEQWSFVKKARNYEELSPMDAEGTGSQSPLRKRIRSDSDTGDEELYD